MPRTTKKIDLKRMVELHNEGKTAREIANEFDASVGTIRSYLYNVKKGKDPYSNPKKKIRPKLELPESAEKIQIPFSSIQSPVIQTPLDEPPPETGMNQPVLPELDEAAAKLKKLRQFTRPVETEKILEGHQSAEITATAIQLQAEYMNIGKEISNKYQMAANADKMGLTEYVDRSNRFYSDYHFRVEELEKKLKAALEVIDSLEPEKKKRLTAVQLEKLIFWLLRQEDFNEPAYIATLGAWLRFNGDVGEAGQW